jgi:hypothetical protein
LPRYSDDHDANFRREVDEGSAQDKLHRRHQELRKKSGLPDPDYYKELKASYDIEDDAKRIAAQAEIKKKYQVAETVLNPKDPQGDYDAKRKVIHDLSLDPNVDQQAVQQRRLDLDREAKSKGLKEQGVAEGSDNRQWSNKEKETFRRNVAGLDDMFGKDDAWTKTKQRQIKQQIKTKPMAGPKGQLPEQQGVAETGPFSYGAKKPRKGSVADLAAKKRQEQEKNKKPIEPKDQMVGVAKVITNEDAVGKIVGKMVPGAGSAINAVDAVRRYKSGDKVGAGIAAAGIVPLVSYPALATDVVRDKMNTGRWLPSDEERDLANLNSQIEKMEKTSWQELPGGYKRSPDKQTISGPVTKVAPEPKSKSVPDSMQPDSESLPSRPYPEKQVTNEDIASYLEEMRRAGYDIVTEAATLCPECGGPAYNNQMLAEKQDACYHKVKSRYKVWPSAYASGALVRCRKKGAKNWGNKSKK